uniref:Uncharacterized protein n=1 Tax=Rhizobium rhizogenes TaxID=359 RepID=A0A7S5DRR1_RHIRH|nr:hypothetical protein pC5.7b_257 [Rhizobium rhizogenes]QCL09506.1 hypothetical protein pC5.8a_14 [Rhizobium rhizogenes]QCL10151.1 hypothetical protein pC6.5b_256 [Rhizobium rhizogenes]
MKAQLRSEWQRRFVAHTLINRAPLTKTLGFKEYLNLR